MKMPDYAYLDVIANALDITDDDAGFHRFLDTIHDVDELRYVFGKFGMSSWHYDIIGGLPDEWFKDRGYDNDEIPFYEFLIRENADILDWEEMTAFVSTNEHIVRDFFDRIDVDAMLMHSIFSEKFIHDFRDKLNWQIICSCQRMSCDFVKEHMSYIEPYLDTLLNANFRMLNPDIVKLIGELKKKK